LAKKNGISLYIQKNPSVHIDQKTD